MVEHTVQPTTSGRVQPSKRPRERKHEEQIAKHSLSVSNAAARQVMERAKWSDLLDKLLVGSGTPVTKLPMKTAGAGRRAGTLRKRVYALRGFVTWLETEKQAKFPNKVEDLIEYFTERE